MTYIIADPCVGTCDTACVEVCPVDCIHGPEDKEGAGSEAKEPGFDPTGKQLYIDPEECIDCGACEPECPVDAINEAAVNWKYSDGTSLSGDVNLLDGKIVNAELPQRAVNDEIYYIVPDKCTECQGFHEEPQCAAVCPVDCCIPDLNNIESSSQLLEKQKLMHN
jgi:ferredoxin